MNSKTVKSLLVGLIATVAFTSVANAHLISLGWKDNGNGSVTLFGEHWHGNLAAPSSANGGIGIYTTGNVELFRVQWTSIINNGKTRADMLADGDTTGFAEGFHNDFSNDQDYLVTSPIALGNGTYNFFTGTNCCIDTMDDPVTVTITGVTSVPPGTVGGSVPDSGSVIAMLGLSLLGLGFIRRRFTA